MKSIILYIIKIYQYCISPLLGNNCRFYPCCSEYGKEAILLHGCIKGLILTIIRLSKCHPLCNGGYDPVPSKDNN